MTELCTINNTLNCKLDMLEGELKSARSEVNVLQALIKENKETMAQARENSRRSIVGVETKLEQIAAVSQSQVAMLRTQLAEEATLRSELQQQLVQMEADVVQKDAEVRFYTFLKIFLL